MTIALDTTFRHHVRPPKIQKFRLLHRHAILCMQACCCSSATIVITFCAPHTAHLCCVYLPRKSCSPHDETGVVRKPFDKITRRIVDCEARAREGSRDRGQQSCSGEYLGGSHVFFPPGAARRWGAACSCNREWGCAIWVCSQSTVHQSGVQLGATLNTEVTVFFVGPTWLWMVLLR